MLYYIIRSKALAGTFFLFEGAVILLIASLAVSFYNFLKNDPHNNYLTISYVLLAISALSALFILFTLKGYSPFSYYFYIAVLVSFAAAPYSIIYGKKALEKNKDWIKQHRLNLFFCAIFVILALLGILTIFGGGHG